MNAVDLISHQLEGITIQQRKADGYFDATAMCRAVGKDFYEYRRAKPTVEFLAELGSVTGLSRFGLIKVIRGGPPYLQGTWIHPDVAVHLAQWCSPKFAVAVAQWVRQWFEFKVDVSGWLRVAPLPWQKTFPDSFYGNIFRLKGKTPVPKEQAKWLGDITNDLIYSRLAEGVLEALQNVNAVPEGKRWRSRKHHQYIEEGEAKTQLRCLIAECSGVMSSFYEWNEFHQKWDALHPRVTDLPREVEFKFTDAQLLLFRLEPE
jgi:hypothetical protein